MLIRIHKKAMFYNLLFHKQGLLTHYILDSLKDKHQEVKSKLEQKLYSK